MSFLLGNSKIQFLGDNRKAFGEKKNPLSQRDFYQKLISNKKYSEIDISKLYANAKDNKKLSPRYNTLKNSRNKINLI